GVRERIPAARRDQLHRLFLPATEGDEYGPYEDQGRTPRRLRNRIGLVQQRERFAQFSGVEEEAGLQADDYGKEAEGSRRPRALGAATHQLLPSLLVEEIGCDTTCHPQPPVGARAALPVLAKRLQRPTQRWHAGRVALGDASRETVEQQVAWPQRRSDRSRR